MDSLVNGLVNGLTTGLATYHRAVEDAARPFTLHAAFAPVDDVLSVALAEPLGFHLAQVKTIAIFLLAYPLGLALQALPGAHLRHAAALVVGVVLAQYAMGAAWVHSLVSTTVAYALMAVLPRRAAPWGVFAVTLAYLVYAHYRRMINSELNDDFSSAQMVLTIKLTTLAFQLVDGAEAAKRTAATASASAAPAPAAAAADPAAPAPLRSVPNPLEYYGFCYFFGSFFVGPAFHYDEYIKSITRTKYRTTIDPATNKPVRRYPPGQALAVLQKFVLSVLFLAYYAMLVPTHNIPSLVTDRVVNMPVLERFVYWWITLSVERTKYYFAWTISEGACIAAGFGWAYKSATAVEGSADYLAGAWDAVNNMNPWAFETAQSFSEASRAWNRLTSQWLRFCVYTRTPPAIRTIATYTVSAFWHGFYPGYYVFFLCAGVFQEIGTIMRKTVRPHFVDGSLKAYKGVYDALGVLFIPVVINYLSTAFLLLRFDYIVIFWSSWYFAGHIAAAVFYVALLFVPRVRTAKGAGKAATANGSERLKKEE